MPKFKIRANQLSEGEIIVEAEDHQDALDRFVADGEFIEVQVNDWHVIGNPVQLTSQDTP